MNTPMLSKLREHLATISKEQFRAEWKDIEALNLQGPSYEEFIKSLSLPKTIAVTEPIAGVSSDFDFEKIMVSAGENSYALAA